MLNTQRRAKFIARDASPHLQQAYGSAVMNAAQMERRRQLAMASRIAEENLERETSRRRRYGLPTEGCDDWHWLDSRAASALDALWRFDVAAQESGE